MTIPFDQNGNARAALGEAVRGYGQPILGNPQLLRSVLGDLLAGVDRERGLLIAAAEANIARSLRDQVEQGVHPQTAVDLVTHTFIERYALDAAAARWVAIEFALALGYAAPPTMVVPSAAPPPPPPQAAASAPVQDTIAMSGPTGPAAPPVYFPVADQVPAYAPPAYAPSPVHEPIPRQSHPYGSGAIAVPFPPKPASHRRRDQAIAAAVGVLLVGYFAVAAGGHLPPFSTQAAVVVTSTPPPTPAPTTPTASPTPPPTPTLPSGITPLTQLLPNDITDVLTHCQAMSTPSGLQLVGVVSELQCTDPTLPGGNIYAFQFDSTSDYDTDWTAFNGWLGFSAQDDTGQCPPASTGSNPEGQEEFKSGFDPDYVQGQVLECLTVEENEPSYSWTYPDQFAIITAQGAPDSSFADLATWWADDAGPSAQ